MVWKGNQRQQKLPLAVKELEKPTLLHYQGNTWIRLEPGLKETKLINL